MGLHLSPSLSVMENSPVGDWKESVEQLSNAQSSCLSCKQISDSVAGMLLGDVTAQTYGSG